jgi:hypothetical protein
MCMKKLKKMTVLRTCPEIISLSRMMAALDLDSNYVPC